MKKLTTLTLIGAASALALGATAASAQPYGGRYDHESRHDSRYDNRQDSRGSPRMNISERLAQIARRIDRGVQRGDLTRLEARDARGQYRQIAHRVDMYRTGGYNRTELAEIDNRLDRLERQVRIDRRDNQYGYGYGQDYRR